MVWDGLFTRFAALRNPRISQGSFKRPLELGLAVVAVMSLYRILPELGEPPPPLVLAGVVMFLVMQVLVAVECLFHPRLSWVMVAGLVTGISLVVVGQLRSGSGPAIWHTDAWFAVPFAFFAVIEPRARQVWVLAVATVTGFLILAATSPMDWRSQLLSMLFTAAPIAVLALARLAVVAIVDECLDSQRERDERSFADEVATTRSRAIASLRRDMHDTLLHCLQLVGAPWSLATEPEVRSTRATKISSTASTKPSGRNPATSDGTQDRSTSRTWRPRPSAGPRGRPSATWSSTARGRRQTSGCGPPPMPSESTSATPAPASIPAPSPRTGVAWLTRWWPACAAWAARPPSTRVPTGRR